jgi:hypothetical protein
VPHAFRQYSRYDLLHGLPYLVQLDLLLPREPSEEALVQRNSKRVDVHSRFYLQLVRIVLVLEIDLRRSVREGIGEARFGSVVSKAV